MAGETIQEDAAEAWRARIRAIADVLAAPPAALPADDDVHAALAALTDRLLERAAVFGNTLQSPRGRLDESEALAARLILSDLSLVAAAWRTLGAAAAARLTAAEAELGAARAILDPVLAEADE